MPVTRQPFDRRVATGFAGPGRRTCAKAVAASSAPLRSPGWDALQIRPEIIDASGQIDDVQMSLGDAVYATGARR
ncbi:MAG: hypothetical protein ACKN9D_13700, partial [Actinomycetales bacterium]